MDISSEGILIIVVIGIVAGWLAGRITQGAGFGIVGDLIVGILGAFIGSWLLPRLLIYFGVGVVAAILDATIGAVLLLLVIGLLRGGNRWRRV